MDGRDYTIGYGEDVDSPNYTVMGWNGWKKMWGFDQPNFIAPDLKDRTWGPVFLWGLNSEERTPINLNGPDLSSTKCEDKLAGRFTSNDCNADAGLRRALWARLSSSHGGGVNVAFASGRVLFLRETVDYAVYVALMTPFDKKSDSLDPNYQLGDNDIR